jgi:hypothetical protein
MSLQESISVAPSMARGARTCTSSNPNLHQIIGTVCSLHPRGAAKWLQRVTGRSTRTVKYWLAGDYEPRGKDTLKIAGALRIELAEQHQRLQQFELCF